MKKDELTFSWDFVSLVGWRYALAVPISAGILFLVFWLINFETLESSKPSEVFDTNVLLLNENELRSFSQFKVNSSASLQRELEEGAILNLDSLISEGIERMRAQGEKVSFAQFQEVPLPDFTAKQSSKGRYEAYFPIIKNLKESPVVQRPATAPEFEVSFNGLEESVYIIFPGELTNDLFKETSLPVSYVVSINEIGEVDGILPTGKVPIGEPIAKWIENIKFIDAKRSYLTLSINLK